MTLPIRALKKGDGLTQLSFTVGNKYSRISEELKDVRFGEGGVYKIIVYRIYNHQNEMVVEMETCSGLVIYYGSHPVDKPVNN